MKTTTIIIASALALGAACTSTETQCERTMGMSKDGVPIMLGEPCLIAPAYVPRIVEAPYSDGESRSRPAPTRTRTSNPSTPHSEPDGPTSEPDGPTSEPDGPTSEPDGPTSDPDGPTSDPDGPTSEPDGPTSEPDGPTSRPDRPRGDNSDANGKGGNKHDRDDFTHGGTETAEERKND